LDRRGILQSVASRNDPDQALRLLATKRLAHLFVKPQIGWGSKVRSVQTISGQLGVSLDAMALIDDEPFERERVRRVMPAVRTYSAERTGDLLGLREFSPSVLSRESRTRRRTYQKLNDRDRARRGDGMSHSEFLRWCNTALTLRTARIEDLPRIQELLQRTHQLNATGVVWPPEQIAAWLEDPTWQVFVAELRDRFVDYGRIGVAVCHRQDRVWELVAFMLSCRVLSRGISGFFLAWIRRQAARAGALELRAQFRRRSRNHLMEKLFRLAGLDPSEEGRDGLLTFVGPTLPRARPPRWLTVYGAES
jgi:methoxymalonate biosynthesis protein